MDITKKYIEKHKELLELGSQINSMLNVDKINSDALELRNILATLAGKLKVHLATEDRFLYPQLLKSSNENVRKTAMAFFDEMGGIYDEFSSFLERWPGASALQKNPDKFIPEMKGMLQALTRRIEREDNELYPLAQIVGESSINMI